MSSCTPTPWNPKAPKARKARRARKARKEPVEPVGPLVLGRALLTKSPCENTSASSWPPGFLSNIRKNHLERQGPRQKIHNLVGPKMGAESWNTQIDDVDIGTSWIMTISVPQPLTQKAPGCVELATNLRKMPCSSCSRKQKVILARWNTASGYKTTRSYMISSRYKTTSLIASYLCRIESITECFEAKPSML